MYPIACTPVLPPSYPPEQDAAVPDHVPSAWHSRKIEPRSLKPGLQSKITFAPYVNSLPTLKPFAGDPGSPQFLTAMKCHNHILIPRLFKLGAFFMGPVWLAKTNNVFCSFLLRVCVSVSLITFILTIICPCMAHLVRFPAFWKKSNDARSPLSPLKSIYIVTLWFSNFCLKDVKKSCICIKAIIIHGRNDYTLHYTKFRKKEIWHHDLSDLTYLAGNSESERNCFFLLAWRIVIFNVQSWGGGGGEGGTSY